MTRKTHHTAVALVPPPMLWEPIQAIRRLHDRHVQRWMPHINLLYPFVPQAQFPEVLPRLHEVGRQIAACEITLAVFRSFVHSSRSATLWLDPEPHAPLLQLQAALHAAFPQCDDLTRFPAGFTPHLSVAQATSKRALQALQEACQAHWQPLHWPLTNLALLCRTGDTPFQVAHTIPLHSA